MRNRDKPPSPTVARANAAIARLEPGTQVSFTNMIYNFLSFLLNLS